MWFDVQVAYQEITGRKLPPSTPKVTPRPCKLFATIDTTPTIKTQSRNPAFDVAGLNHREQAVCSLVAKGNRKRTHGETITHALIDRLIERGRIIEGKDGRLTLC